MYRLGKTAMGKNKTKILFVGFLGILFFPSFSFADSQGQTFDFFIDSNYSLGGKEQVHATLQKVSQSGYFYIENEWYQNLSADEKNIADQNLENLSLEFDKNIYPKLTSDYGKEWSPGVDNDARITILFHQTKEDAMGYFNSGDEYSKLQNPKSNEREMVYLNCQSLLSPSVKSYLAHEFTHLITFNQKDRLNGVSEEVWLNEARAEYAPTLLGYDNEYSGSNLEQRVKIFLSSPSNSLTDWQGQKADYGVINLFTQYLADRYGAELLSDSMKSSKTGIASINDALTREDYGASVDFSKIFSDWTIAIYLNDCALGENYCYKNSNLKNLRIVPSLIFFPSTQKTKIILDYSVSQWSGNWYRIIGGKGKVDISFNGFSGVKFKVPYILCQDDIKKCVVDFLLLDNSQNGTASFENFGKDWTSLILLPSIQSEISGMSGYEPTFNFSLSASMANGLEEEALIKSLQAKILELQNKIAEIQAKINAILGKNTACLKIESNLYYGMANNYEVKCLQEFLKSQGANIYPEGLVTGNFFSATKAAVARFQEKYASEILTPMGLQNGTGVVGEITRNKINEIMAR